MTEFKNKFEDLSHKICINSKGQSEQEIDEEEEFVIDVTTNIIRRVAELAAHISFIDRQSAKTNASQSTSNEVDAIQRKIDKLVELQELQLSSPNLSSTAISETSEPRHAHSVRLPTIEFDKISGDVLKFQEFWDSFSAAIDTNPSLRSVQKLNYLRAYLSGDAKQVISGITTCDNNYQVAVDLIRKRFGNPQSSIDAHYKIITTLQIVPNHTPKIRSLADQIEKHLRCLSALGEDVEHRHFISLIMSKLPREVVVRLEESKPDEEPWSVSVLRNKLQSLLNARESAERQQPRNEKTADVGMENYEHRNHQIRRWSEKQPEISSSWRANLNLRPNTTQGLVAGDNYSSQTHLRCIFCKGSHFNDQCVNIRSAGERRRALRGYCHICLGKDHSATDCRSTKPCFYCKQIRQHNRCLCPKRFREVNDTSAVTADHHQEDDTSIQRCPNEFTATSSEVSVLASGDRVLLQTAMVEVTNPKSSVHQTTRVLLDCASNRSYVSAEFAQKLQLKGQGYESISVVTFGSDKPKTVQTSNAQLEVLPRNGEKKTIDVSVVPKITGSICRSPVKFPKSHFLWQRLPLADSFPNVTQSGPIDFLIGNDYYLEFITGEKIEVGNGLFLLGSSFGWLLTGRVENEKSKENGFSMFINSSMNHSISQVSCFSSPDENLPLKPSFQDYWKLESIGINDDPEVNDDDKAVTQFNLSVQFRENRYYVSWPWKDDAPELPENYHLAYGRFVSLLKKFKDNPSLFKRYGEIIEDQEQKGIVEKVNDDSNEPSLKHYIPHHAVVTPTKTTTKVRIVYDGSAKVHKKAKSLNECLLRGPIILEDLCGLLLRFRTFPIGIISDIEKAFLQVGLDFPDKDVTRFFWLRNSQQPSLQDNNLQIYRFCRVPFGAISSPFLLAATLKHDLLKSSSSVASKIRTNLYVDNLVTGTNSLEEAVEFYEESKNTFKEASMNLREWASNAKDFTDKLPEEDKVKSTVSSVLGLQWSTDSDSLYIKSASITKIKSATTKRQLFKSLASVFDPMGFFTPITVRGKLFIHQLWKHSLEWDDPVDSQYQEEWQTIANQLAEISNCQIPRFIGKNEKEVRSIQLICFCDASAQAYAAVVYARISTNGGSVINLLFAKSRLAPSKSITIPRMELLGVLIGIQCLRFTEKQLRIPVSGKILWTDSQCVLHWISSHKPLPIFVENRLKEIKKAKDVQFRYVVSQENPADIATRGEYTLSELQSSIWWKGPSWLSKEETYWPNWAYNHNSASSEYIEDVSFKDVNLVSKSILAQPPYGIDIQRFSTLTRLYRVSAWMQRFIDKARNKFKGEDHLSSSDLSLVKKKWDYYIQYSEFPEIFNGIEHNKHCNIKEQLNVYKDEHDILRCRGRFSNSDQPDCQKNPILLSKENYYTKLVIKDTHKNLMHSGVSHTLSQLRLEYWIPQGRSAVRKVLSQCVVCRKHGGGAYKTPDMPPWPPSRVSRSTPFSYIGLDYIGPLYVKCYKEESPKVWICLFTCMSVRAVHLEIAEDLSAFQFLLCLRRFIARRGKPTQIISDNASQFKLSKNAIERLWAAVVTDPDVTSYVSSQGINWQFIIEAAPWMGGFYERLVGIVKSSLKKCIGKQRLTLCQLNSVVAEVEAVVNCRPIISKGESLNDVRCISPSSFLSLSGIDGIPPLKEGDVNDPSYVPFKSPASSLLDSWKKGHRILEQFWNIWNDEYLACLRERSSFRHKQHRIISPFVPSVGDVVMIGDNIVPRGSWKLARIQQLIPSYDKVVRAARVKLASGNVTSRPLKLLYPLECSNVSPKVSHTGIPPMTSPAIIQPVKGQCAPETFTLKVDEPKISKTTTTALKEVKLPKRAAAIKAERVLKAMVKDGQV